MRILKWLQEFEREGEASHVCGPKLHFLFENVASMSPDDRSTMQRALGVDAFELDAAQLTSTKRKRVYFFNWEARDPKKLGYSTDKAQHHTPHHDLDPQAQALFRFRDITTGTEREHLLVARPPPLFSPSP